MGFETFGSAKLRYNVAIAFCLYSAVVLSGFLNSNLFNMATEVFAGLTVGNILSAVGAIVAFWIYKNAV